MRRGLGMLLVLPMLATAGDVHWYVGGRTSIGRMVMSNADHGATVGTGVLIDGVTDGALLETSTRDYSNGIGGAIGLDSEPWRLEGELIWRYRSDWDLTAPTPSDGNVTLFRTNYGTTTLFLNVMRRGALGGRWLWEYGAGIGLVRKKYQSEFTKRGDTRGLPSEILVKETSRGMDVGWQLLAGITRQIGEHWSMHIRYRYADFGDLETGRYRQRNEQVNADLDTHEMTLGFERHL